MLKILLVDDHSVVRAGIRQILQDASFPVDIGEAVDAEEALTSVRETKWDLVLLDIRLPGKSGVEVLKQLKMENPKLPVLILSTYPESQYAVRLIHSGAAGYLAKDAEDSEILSAVKVAASGKRFLTPAVAELLANYVSSNSQLDDQDSIHERLSDREYQIFIELANGLGPNEIAAKLEVSAKTITTHRSRILQKMGLTKNAELTLYASNRGLL